MTMGFSENFLKHDIVSGENSFKEVENTYYKFAAIECLDSARVYLTILACFRTLDRVCGGRNVFFKTDSP